MALPPADPGSRIPNKPARRSPRWAWGAAGLLAAWAVLDYVPRPCLLLLPACALAAALGAAVLQRRPVRLLLMNLALVLAVLSPLEYVLAFTPDPLPPPAGRFEGSYGAAYFVDDPVLGYGPRRDARTTSRKIAGTSVVYDVSYGVDALGLRQSPPTASNAPCLVCFGCSYTFGEGVNDDETLPWQVSRLSGGRYATLNFGFHGYGPHHMLAALQAGRVEQALASRAPAGAVCSLLPDHARRCAGLAAWARQAPRYVVDQAGHALRSGCYGPQAEPGTLALWVRWETGKSAIGRRLLRRFDSRIPDDQLALLVAVVSTARTDFERRFPTARFHVLYWEEGTDNDRRILAALNALGINPIRVSALLPGWPDQKQRWMLPGDPHPTPAAYRTVAAGLVRWITPAN